MKFENIAVSFEGPIATLRLSRPDQNNAFDEGMHDEFVQALAMFRLATDIRVVLLSAEGEHFSAGNNLDYVRRLHQEPVLRRRRLQKGKDIFHLLNDMHVPIIAAVQGNAFGLGATIVTACDVIVAWREAQLGDRQVRVGLVAGDGGTLSWSSAAGFNRARRLLLTGDAISAERAYEFGVVTDLVDAPEAVLPEAKAIAERIAALPPMAVQGTKKAFNALARTRNGSALDMALEAELATIVSQDLEEALDASYENRSGNYHNF